MANSALWILFILFVVVGTSVFLYAFRSLGPTQKAERQVMELQDRLEEEE